ncbi:EF-hand domain-containing protein [Roseicella aquatilis]|uniref:EF-hand domain-containing protein n=1 Tax=Roseicella aquatilis TaxID=2527868 RepID=A0A4R4DNG7_9PROT|nr:EF-hand domain-containing protein [Roseicella aquatilis]TCZ61402.1 hypothetical protein EXY23_12740 [Roseicella aquatilis]
MRTALALALGALLALPAPASAQFRPDWSPWGGPDSPGGLFGGDPREAVTDPDQGVTHDQVWLWLRGRFEQADRDRSGTITPDEIRGRADAQATFRAADADRNGQVTPDELRPLSEQWFRAHDANSDDRLTRQEVKAQKRRPKPQAKPAG